MTSSKQKKGDVIHSGAKLDRDQLKLVDTQDLRYVSNRRVIDEKKIEKMKKNLHLSELIHHLSITINHLLSATPFSPDLFSEFQFRLNFLQLVSPILQTQQGRVLLRSSTDGRWQGA
mmetsp:Transcript_13846/g.13627  ORF Transcript_13846/g.13627 Transcript_13846/m.13627 type:complete len:117 (+) Transcript_13846:228-578(+)